MANEANVRAGLQIRKASGNLVLMDENISIAYTATVTGTKGPTPGDLTIPVGGKIIRLDELTTPGFCVLLNRDAANYVEYGAFDQDTGRAFLPFELGPGEGVVVKLSRNITEEYTNTGTGTTGVGGYWLFMKANGAAVVVSVKAYER